jgi:hypothetical protein
MQKNTVTRKAVATTHHDRMHREQISQQLDLLCERADLLAADYPRRDRTVGQIAQLNVECQVED